MMSTNSGVDELYGSFGLSGEVAEFLEWAKGIEPSPAMLSRKDYLSVVSGIVNFFSAYQNKDGAIIDVYERREIQYATPAFAFAAATLASSGFGEDFLSRAIDAMDRATGDLIVGRAADKHQDFYTVLLMHALKQLENQAPPEKVQNWRHQLGAINPSEIYARQPSSGFNNWNLVAAGGEFMRQQAGLAVDADWIEESLACHMDKFTGLGLYRDPGDPLAYDLFGRLQVVNMLQEGYQGPRHLELSELMERGAWTSLFMQSPQGEAPCGGRSGHHQWNEAVESVIFEVYARVYARQSDSVSAGAFRRGARLALNSILRWVRPTGDLWIVKNRYDPKDRHGYEGYSFHSQYNLLTAAILCLAYIHSDDAIAEGPCPAEAGGFVFHIEPLRQCFANADGLYVQINTGADLAYNPTGLVRVHKAGVNPQLSISDGATSQCSYNVMRRPAFSLAIGPAWCDNRGRWHALSDHQAKELAIPTLDIKCASRQKVEFDLVYKTGLRAEVTELKQSYSMSASRLVLTDQVTGPISGFRQYLPLLITDGHNSMTIDVEGNNAVSRHYDCASSFSYRSEVELTRVGCELATRNGTLDAVYAETKGDCLTVEILPLAKSAD